MKLFQQLLVAGAAASMIAPIAAQASDINLEDMNSYSASSRSAGFTNNYLNVQPGDWAHQSIKDLVNSRGCTVDVSDKSLTRFEAAAIVNSCLGDVAEVSNVERSLIDEFSSEIALLRGRVDGIEARMNEFEAGSFSSTTTMDGKAVFVFGAVDGNSDLGEQKSGGTDTLAVDLDGDGTNDTTLVTSKAKTDKHSEALSVGYVYQMNLNTSFTGDDNLYVRLKTSDGFENFTSKPGNYLNEAGSGGSVITVDKIWYTFPIGDKVEATVGPKIENYYMLAATPSVYKPKVLKAFRFGGHGIAFGASTSTGLGLKYTADNGFASSVTINSKGAQGTNGFLTDADVNKLNVQVAYTTDNWHLSGTYTSQHGKFDAFHYYSTDTIDESTDKSGYALRAWWRPDETGTAVPSISFGFDTVDFADSANAGGFENGNGYSIAFNWQDIVQADDTIGVAFGSPISGSDNTTAGVEDVDPFLWEAYYSFRPNDSIEITPGIFGGTDVRDDSTDDIFGAVLQTTFRF